jgi:hypothetical protein
MSSVAAVVINIMLGPNFYGLPPAQDLAAVTARYEKECPGSRTPSCKRMQWQMEAALYGMLRVNRAAFDAEILAVALAADVPRLQSYGLARSSDVKPFPSQLLPRVVALLESPYAMVRRSALDVLARHDPKYERYAERSKDKARGQALLSADQAPAAARLGAPLYAGATYRAFASSPQEAWYTTADPPDRVLAFYATGGNTARTAQELSAAREARKNRMRDPGAMVQMMMKAQAEGKSPEQIQAMLMGTAKASAGHSLAPFEKEGMTNPRFIELDNEGERLLAIFKDQILGATAIVYLLPDPAIAAREAYVAKMSPEEQMEEQLRDIERLQMFINKPMIKP